MEVLTHHITIYVLVGLLFLGCKKDVSSVTLEQQKVYVKVSADKGNKVGQKISFIVTCEDDDFHGTAISVVLDNGLTVKTYRARIGQKIELPESDFLVAGVYNLLVKWKDKIIGRRTFNLLPEKIVDPLEVYVGPVSIVTGGKQKSMVAIVPSDKYDNPILDSVSVEVIISGARENIITTTTSNLYASTTLQSTDNVSDILLGSSLRRAAASEQVINQVPDWSTGYDIYVADYHPYADNRKYTRIKTSTLRDNYNNIVADGTIVTFQATEEGKIVSVYNAITIDGIASAYMRNPAKETTWIVSSHVGQGSASNKLSIDYQSILNRIN